MPPQDNASCVYTSEDRIHAKSDGRHEECHYILLNKISHQDNTMIINMCAANIGTLNPINQKPLLNTKR